MPKDAGGNIECRDMMEGLYLLLPSLKSYALDTRDFDHVASIF